MLVTLQEIIGMAEKGNYCIPAFNFYNVEKALYFGDLVTDAGESWWLQSSADLYIPFLIPDCCQRSIWLFLKYLCLNVVLLYLFCDIHIVS